MRAAVLAAALGLVASLFGSRPARSDDAGAPLLRKDMKNWARAGAGKSPWGYTTAGTLTCAAAADRYVYEVFVGDGALHLEWRFQPAADPKKVPAASVTVRGTEGGEQCKIALGAGCGSISATAQSSSDRIKTFEVKAAAAKPNPADEWNTADITLAGKSVAVTLNGDPVSSFGNCSAAAGVISLNAEGAAIEFRNVRWKAGR